MRGKNMPAEHDEAIRSILPIWTGVLRDESGATFDQVAAPHVRLEGSIFARPIDGREKVWASLRAGGGITDTLSFTHESAAPGRSYLEWELEAFGQRFAGVTVLSFDGSGLIDNVALHHRPSVPSLPSQLRWAGGSETLPARVSSTRPVRPADDRAGSAQNFELASSDRSSP
jgi:hypothetical protein